MTLPSFPPSFPSCLADPCHVIFHQLLPSPFVASTWRYMSFLLAVFHDLFFFLLWWRSFLPSGPTQSTAPAIDQLLNIPQLRPCLRDECNVFKVQLKTVLHVSHAKGFHSLVPMKLLIFTRLSFILECLRMWQFLLTNPWSLSVYFKNVFGVSDTHGVFVGYPWLLAQWSPW